MIDKKITDKKLICPITYETLIPGERYSKKGLSLLSPKLQTLNDLPYTAEQQRIESRQRADKISIQGVQPKVSAKLDIKPQGFVLCNVGGNYILKPPSELYPELPENEDLTMRLAEKIIEVPMHGLIYSIDGSLTYFIKRFDRVAYKNKLAVEDFSQLAGMDRETKYNFSMEKIIPLLDKYCTFPAIEKSKLFTRVIFNFLIGNEDMHLKNFSLLSRDGKIELAPAYDFVNTTLAMGKAKEEIALTLNGKKSNLKRVDFIDYYGLQKLQISQAVINSILDHIVEERSRWEQLIRVSFLSEESKDAYLQMLDKRFALLQI